MKIRVTMAVLVLLSGIAAPLQAGEVNFFLGERKLEDEFDPVDEQTEFGAQITAGPKSWPVRIAVDILASSDERTMSGLRLEASTTELDVGVRKIWTKGKARPFFGGGLAVVDAELETAAGPFALRDQDSGTGVWVSGGAFWRIGRRFNVGVEARVSRASADLFGLNTEIGGEHLGALLGWGW